MQADVLNGRSDYKADKSTSKQFLTKKNEVLKLTKCSEDLERIIKEHHEFKDPEDLKIQKIYEKIM